MTRTERANRAAEYGFPLPPRWNGQPAYADFGSALSIGGSILGGLMGEESSENAADSQERAARDAAQIQAESNRLALEEQRRQFDLTREDSQRLLKDTAALRDPGAVKRLDVLLGLKKYAGDPQTLATSGLVKPTQAGNPNYKSQLAQYNADLAAWNARGKQPVEADEGYGDLNKKFTLADFWDDPVTKASYAQGLELGTKALENMGNASGMRKSGAQLKALTRFATDYTGGQAAGSSSRFYGDQDRIFNRLIGRTNQQQTGINSAAGTIGAGSAQSNNISNLIAAGGNTQANLITGLGNARGAAAIAGGNALAGGIGSAVNNYQQQRTLNALLGRNTPSQAFTYDDTFG